MIALQDSIGYRFKDPALLEAALTHPSCNKTANNQRLEFLGDAVLGLVVARVVYDLFPGANEGDLARRHAALVRGETLVGIARELKLGQALIMAASESKAGGGDNASNLEDALEALIGAIYLDGGMAAAEQFILPRWQELAKQTLVAPKDAKTSLQEWSQGRGLSVPSYALVSSSGPAHAPIFTVEVTVEGFAPARGEATSKRAAEQLAAAALLELLEKL